MPEKSLWERWPLVGRILGRAADCGKANDVDLDLERLMEQHKALYYHHEALKRRLTEYADYLRRGHTHVSLEDVSKKLKSFVAEGKS